LVSLLEYKWGFLMSKKATRIRHLGDRKAGLRAMEQGFANKKIKSRKIGTL
jgi:hypothetical protein